MDTLSGSKVFKDLLSDKLHAETQVEPESVSLTAGKIHALHSPGDLDFGGGEFQLAERSPIEPMKRKEEDDYGWWALDEGQYILELNENIQLDDNHRAVLFPHDHLNWNGSMHPTLWLSNDDSSMKLLLTLSVGANGINIKENARVTSLKVFKEA